MLIKKIHIHGFGKLHDREYELSKGLNIIHGGNESGKTTLTAFLLNMLGEPGEEILKYEPWHHELFGGALEWEEGCTKVDFREGGFQALFPKKILENAGFLFEDQYLWSPSEIDCTVIAALRKKMEGSHTGCKIRTLIERLKQAETQIPEEIQEISRSCRSLDEQLRGIENDIALCNETYKKKKELMEEFGHQERCLNELQSVYKNQSDEHVNELQRQLSKLNEDLAAAKLKKKKYAWVENKAPDDIEKVKSLTDECDEVKRQIDTIGGQIEEVRGAEQRVQTELKKQLELLNIGHVEDLEKVHNTIQQLDLLNRLKKKTGLSEEKENEKTPLREFFSNNEDILDRIDPAAEHSDSEQLQVRQGTGQGRPGSSPWLYSSAFIISASLAIISLIVSFYEPLFSRWLYAATAGFAFLALIVGALWAKRKSSEASFYEGVVADYRKLERSPDWKVLNELGIFDIRQLQKAYIDFVDWRSRQKSDEDRRSQAEEINEQLDAMLKRFKVDPAVTLLDQKISWVKSCFFNTQNLAVDSKHLEERRKSYQEKEKFLSEQKIRLESDIAGLLKELDLRLDQVCAFDQAFENYRQTKNELEQLESKVETLQKDLSNGDNPPEHLMLTDRKIKASQQEMEGLSRHLGEVSYQLETQQQQIDRAQLNSILALRDQYSLNLKTLKASMASIIELEELVQRYFAEYTNGYAKEFKDEFSNICTSILGRDLTVDIGDNLAVNVSVGGRLVNPKEVLSSAALHQMLFAFKVALQRRLPGYDFPFVIDNALIRYDDDRLNEVMKLIAKEAEDRQIIIMTSDHRLGSFGHLVPIE